GGDLLRCSGSKPLQLLSGRGDVRVASLLGHLLGARQDVVRLAPRLCERREPLLLRVLAVGPGLLRVLQAPLDPSPALGEQLADGPEREALDDDQEEQEVDSGYGNPEPVEDESGTFGSEGRRRRG